MNSIPRLPYRLLLAVLAGVLGLAGCSKKDDSGKHLAAADQHFKDREFEKAKIEYMNLLRLQPTNDYVVLQMSKILLAQGQNMEAIPMVLWSRQKFPQDREIHETTVEIFAALGGETNRVRLATEIDQLLELDPANQRALQALASVSRTPEEVAQFTNRLAALRAKAGEKPIFKLVDAELARRRGDTNAAETLLRAAMALDPSDVAPHASYAGFLFAQGRAAEGEAELRKASELAPPSSQVRERWGRYLLEKRRYDEARAVLDEINTKAPERVSAWNARAELALAENKLDDAERFLGRAMGIAPNDLGARRTMAHLKLAKGNSKDAVGELEKIVERQGGSSRSQFQLAVAHLMNRDSVRAEAALEQAVRLNPDLEEATLMLAQMNLSQGEGDKAVLALREAVRRNPDSLRVQLQLVRTELAMGKEDDAFNSVSAAVKRFPTNAALIFQQGLVLRVRKDVPGARAAFERISTLTTNDLLAVEQLVFLDLEAKEFDGALRRIQARIDRDPANASAWVIKGEVLRAKGDLAQAETALRKAIELDPDNGIAVKSLSVVMAASGRTKEAVAELDQLVKVRTNDFGALVRIGDVRNTLGEYPKAREAYEKALALRPNAPTVLNNLAELLAERFKEVEPAREMALKARQAEPQNPFFADTLGWIEYRRGQYAEALRLISEAAVKLGEIPEIQYHLGMAQYMNGQEGPAKTALSLAAAAPRDFSGKEVVREYLAMLEVDGGKADAAAIQALEKRRKEAPGDVIALSRLGAAYELTGAADKAGEALEAALKLNPQSVPVLTRLARLYAQRLNQPEKALELARTARNQAPSDPEVAVALGGVALAAGDQTWAFSLLQEGSRRLTNRPDATFQLAVAAYTLGRVDESVRSMRTLSNAGGDPKLASAASSFLEMTALVATPAATPEATGKIQKVLDADPNHPAALFAYGMVAEAQGQFPNAKTAYERLLARYPGFTPGIRQLTVLASERLGDDAKVQELGAKARQAYPRDDVLTAAVGKSACRRGDFGYAAQVLTEAARTRANDASVWYYLGLASQGLEKKEDARKQLEKALSLEPSAAFADDAKKRLEKLKEG